MVYIYQKVVQTATHLKSNHLTGTVIISAPSVSEG